MSLTDNSGSRVDINGAGQGQTVIQPTSGTGLTTLTVSEPCSTVSDLTLDVAPDATNHGLRNSGGAATRVTVSTPSTATNATAVILSGAASFTSGTAASSNPGTGITALLGTTDTVSDTTITAGTGSRGAGCSRGAVSVDYSDLDPATALDGGNTTPAGGGTASGSITLGAHDVNVDPAFASTSAGAINAFQLTRPSPVIDKGNPTLGSSPAESATDLAGHPRAVAGSAGAGAGAISDIGAFEYLPQAPTVSVAASPTRAVTGAPVRFIATASDPDPTDAVSVSWRFDDGTTANGTSVSHAFATGGTHSATATATDLGGFKATASASLSVAAARPIVSGLSLKPRAFVAAKSGPAVVGAGKSKSRTLVSYRDSQPATSTLTVLRAHAGVRTPACAGAIRASRPRGAGMPPSIRGGAPGGSRSGPSPMLTASAGSASASPAGSVGTR